MSGFNNQQIIYCAYHIVGKGAVPAEYDLDHHPWDCDNVATNKPATTIVNGTAACNNCADYYLKDLDFPGPAR